jgi:hypothetical protein
MGYKRGNLPNDHNPRVADFTLGECFFEAKSCASADPFEFKDDHLVLKNSREHRTTFGQLCDYAWLLNHYNYRTHVFGILIFRDRARFIRWDPMMIFVSDAFSLVERSQYLSYFLHAFASAGPKKQGWDTTVMPWKASDMAENVRADLTRWAPDNQTIRAWKIFNASLSGTPMSQRV